MGKQLHLVLILLGLMGSVAVAHLNTVPPMAAIEYQAGTFNRDLSGGVLHDVTDGDDSKWLLRTVGDAINVITGYAHVGSSGDTQSEANAKVVSVAIWGWLDSDGDGAADVDDAKVIGRRTTRWQKLTEYKPGINGNVIGWEVAGGASGTSAWGDVVQHAAISVKPAESWLLIIRVVDTAGNVNLFDTAGGTEQWEDGDTSNGIGSDVPGDQFLDSNGNTPGTSDARIEDDDVVWIYRPR